MPDLPFVLFVDDQQTQPPVEPKGVAVRTLHPRDLSKGLLDAADLIMVDHDLDEWPERRSGPFASQALDGVAVAAALRAHLRETPPEQQVPKAIALHSGKLELLTHRQQTRHLHLIARTYGLEWAFEKGSPAEILAQQTCGLATAVRALPRHWPDEPDKRSQILYELLGLKNDSLFFGTATADLDRAAPPLHLLSLWTDGLALLRWLLHRVLPYPCFLWNTHQLALRLGVKHSWLKSAVAADTPLRKQFQSAQYSGLLADFAGPRWWGSGVESVLFALTAGRPNRAETLTAVRKLAEDAAQLEVAAPAIAVDEDLVMEDELVSAKTALRVRPDDWPSYAEHVWVPVSVLRTHPHLRALVIEADRESLEEEEEEEDAGSDED